MVYQPSSIVAGTSTLTMVIPFPYLDYNFLKLQRNGVLLVHGVDWRLSSLTEIEFITPNTSGDILFLSRETSSTPITSFDAGNILQPSNLGTQQVQLFHIIEEALVLLARNISLNALGVYDAGNKRITNVANGINDQDVVTVKQLADATANLEMFTEAAALSATNASTSASTAAGILTSILTQAALIVSIGAQVTEDANTVALVAEDLEDLQALLDAATVLLNNATGLADTFTNNYLLLAPIPSVDIYPEVYLDLVGNVYEYTTNTGEFINSNSTELGDVADLTNRVEELEDREVDSNSIPSIDTYPTVSMDLIGNVYMYEDRDGNVVNSISESVDDLINDVTTIDIRVATLEAEDAVLADALDVHPFVQMDTVGNVYYYTNTNGDTVNSGSVDITELQTSLGIGLPDVTPFLYQVDEGLNGIVFLGQSTDVGVKAYKLSTTLPITTDRSLYNLMFDKGLYQPDSTRRTVLNNGEYVAPETYSGLTPLQERQLVGLDTLYTGSTPTGNFYCETHASSTCRYLTEIQGVTYTPVAITRRVEGSNTLLSFQLTSGASVTYRDVNRYVSIQNTEYPEVNKEWSTLSDGNAYTFKITVPSTVTSAPATPSDVRVTVYSNYSRWLPTVSGEGGRSILDFEEGAVYFRRAVGQVRAAMDLARQYGYKYQCHAIAWRQGEANIGGGVIMTKETYKSKWIGLMTALKREIRKVTGQQFDPYVLTYQTGAHLWYAANPIGYIRVAQAHYELCLEGHAIFTSPDYTTNNEDGIHPIAQSVIINSAKISRALKDMREFGERRWLYHTGYTYVPATTTMDITFNVPYGDLVADDDLIPLQTNLGFNVLNAAQTVHQDIITNAQIIGSNTVRLTFSRALTSGEWVRYAGGIVGTTPPHTGYKTDGTPTVGAVGNLHDQDTRDKIRLIDPHWTKAAGTLFTAHNYQPMFEIQIP